MDRIWGKAPGMICQRLMGVRRLFAFKEYSYQFGKVCWRPSKVKRAYIQDISNCKGRNDHISEYIKDNGSQVSHYQRKRLQTGKWKKKLV